MRAVEFDQLCAHIFCPSGCCSKRGDNGRNLGLGKFVWRLVTRAERDSAGSRNGTPASLADRKWLAAFERSGGTGLASGMRELNAGNGALSGDKSKDRLERLGMGITPQAKIVGAYAAFRCYARGFRDNRSGASNSPAAEVDQMPVIGRPSWHEYWHMGGTKIRCGN